MNRLNESGSHLIALAIAVVVIGVVGFSGYKVWMMQQPAVDTQATATSTTVPAKITTTAQLNEAATALDQASAQVNSNLDDSALNTDLSSLL